MSRRRATSTTSISGSIQRNMRYIVQLRRKVRNLEDEAAELSHRLSMLLVDMDVNRTENNNFENFQQEVDQHQDEIGELRQVVEEEPDRQSFDLVDSQPSTSQAACHSEPEDKYRADGGNNPVAKKPKAKKSRAKKQERK